MEQPLSFNSLIAIPKSCVYRGVPNGVCMPLYGDVAQLQTVSARPALFHFSVYGEFPNGVGKTSLHSLNLLPARWHHRLAIVRRTARAGGPRMVDRSTLCRPDSNLNAQVAPTARGRLGPPQAASGDCSERVDNEVGRRPGPPGPAYGPAV